MKKILLLGTGGTIACKRTPDGLKPVITSEEILTYVPDSRHGSLTPFRMKNSV